MNLVHRLCCSSRYWARSVERELLPWALADVDLGDSTLEIGPGYGANMRCLVDMTPRLTAVEIDPPMTERLQAKYGSRAHIINGDGTDTGLPSDEFSSVVCFTMLHHVPTPALQDRLFAEAFRVLRPGAVFMRQRRCALDGVPADAFPRYLQPRLPRRVAGPLAQHRFPRRGGGHRRRATALAGRQALTERYFDPPPPLLSWCGQ